MFLPSSTESLKSHKGDCLCNRTSPAVCSLGSGNSTLTRNWGKRGGLECWKAPVLPIWGLSRPWVNAHQNCRALEKMPALSRAWVWDKGFSEENKGSRLGSSEGHRGQGGAIKGRKWMKWP